MTVHERRLGDVLRDLRTDFGESRVASALCDVTKEAEGAALLDAAEQFGGVDVLIDNGSIQYLRRSHSSTGATNAAPSATRTPSVGV